MSQKMDYNKIGIQDTKFVGLCECSIDNYSNLRHIIKESDDGFDINCFKKSTLTIQKGDNYDYKKLLKLYININPEISMIFNILDEEWIDELLKLSEYKWTFSQTSKGKLSGHPDTYHTSVSNTRKSMSAIFEYGETESISKIEHRVSSIANMDVNYLEKLVMVKYNPGDYFKEHHDGAFRSATILLYINDVLEGGETVFPELGIAIKPIANSGVLWKNIYENSEPDLRLIHAGTTPKKGVKYVVNCFLIHNL